MSASSTSRSPTASPRPWHDVPSTYIITDNDASVPVPVQERMAARAKHVRRIGTGHSPHLAQPAELAALLDEAARTV
ncbi:MAG TPA: alpha/beta hydrolase [Pseudonocardiaceae bacterium]|nr:alpha/beta hydrolase [Pseudonocardiaceae bacterium]